MVLRGRLPRTLKVTPGDQPLRLAVLELQPTKVTTLRISPPLRAESLGRACHLAGASRESICEPAGDASDLEVTTAVTSARFDCVAAFGKLSRQSRAVISPDLACGAENRSGSDRHDPTVTADCIRHDDMTMNLRVGHVAVHDTSSGGVEVLRCNEIESRLFDKPAMTSTDRGNGLGKVRHRLTHGRGVSRLDSATLLLAAKRPDGRDGLRGAEGQVNAAASVSVGACGSNPRAASRMTALHQRDEVLAVDLGSVDP